MGLAIKFIFLFAFLTELNKFYHGLQKWSNYESIFNVIIRLSKIVQGIVFYFHLQFFLAKKNCELQ
jgi:hypothetical protein